MDNDRDDRIEFDGVIVEALPAAMFKVKEASSGNIVICTIAGKIRKNNIRLTVGDKIRFQTSPYDLSRGRVTWRK